jgi:hypothetical protein
MIRDLGWRVHGGISKAVNYEIEKSNWRPTRRQLEIWVVELTEKNTSKYEKTEKKNKTMAQR